MTSTASNAPTQMESGVPAKPAKKGCSTMTIVGIVVAVAVVIAIIAVAVFFLAQPPPLPPSAPPPPLPPAPVSPAAAPNAVLGVLGHWMTNWGTSITVTPTTWYSVSSYGESASAIDSFGQNYLIMQNPDTDAFNPSLWSKVQFHDESANGFAFCTTVFNAPTNDAAKIIDTRLTYNKNNATHGCGAGGFSHSLASTYQMPFQGTYADNWGSYHTITNEYLFSDTKYNTLELFGPNLAVYQTGPGTWDPGSWTKTRFHAVGTGFGFCSVSYGNKNATQALMAPETYNASDAAKGCGAGGYGHTVATPYNLPIAGTFNDNYGTSHTISNTAWGADTIIMYTNNMLVLKTSATAYNPNTYSKYEFHDVSTGGFKYCTSAYNKATSTDALMAAVTYNTSDAAKGCDGSAHTVATKVV